jgi:hypothetical protein
MIGGVYNCVNGDCNTLTSVRGGFCLDCEKSQIKEHKEDVINKPKHYNFATIEPIDVIEDWKLDFRLANALKYISRAGRKDPSKIKEDLEKAVWYIERFIEKECLDEKTK